MDEKNGAPAIKTYSPLGEKTLFMLILKKSAVCILLLPALVVGIIALQYVPEMYFDTAVYVLYGYAAIVFLIICATFFIGWLQYLRYGIVLDSEDVKIQTGLIATEQMGIPYRRIKDVNIKRSLLDQLFGVSDLVITILDSDMNPAKKEPIIFLPSIDQRVALDIQDAMLNRAEVEQIHVSENARQ